MAKGDRNDPEWAWYWKEAIYHDKPDSWAVGPFFPFSPESKELRNITQNFLEDAPRPPVDPEDDQWRKEFLRIARWLPTHTRTLLLTAYPGGRRNTGGWRDLGIPHSSWAAPVIEAEVKFAKLALAWKACPESQRDFRGVLRRVEWPDQLSAWVDRGSTTKVSAELGVPQSTLHQRIAKMSAKEPMVMACRYLRAGAKRPDGGEVDALARELRHQALPKQRRKYSKKESKD